MQTSKICLFLLIVSLNQVSQKAKAQIIPDDTLSLEKSELNSINKLRARISGGATRGSNLFHSFQELNVGTGREVYFANPEGIANIFSRVTGSDISEILGTLGVEGDANLFFVNPNGIVFGENAVVDVGGSFIATTANSIEFTDGTSFGALDNQQEKPILTWNAPIGLGFTNNSSVISVQGTGHKLTYAAPNIPVGSPILGGASSQNGLRVAPNNTLALVGGQINIDGGILTSPSGNIEIGGVEQGLVKLNLNGANISFDYSGVNIFKDVQLDNYALLDASGFLESSNRFASGGIINLYSKNLQVDNGSLIFISNLGEAPFSQININVSESAIFTGITSPLNFGQRRQEIFRGVISQNFSSTQGANISISAKNLTAKNFSFIASNSYAEGAGGDINIATQEKTQIVGISPIPPLFLISSISTSSFESGRAGNIKMSGNSLSIQDGGTVISQGYSAGNSGNIEVKFSDEINIAGGLIFDSNPLDNIETPDGQARSVLGTTAINSGNAGNVLVETEKLKLINGGRINSTASFTGKAGDIIVNTSDSIEIQGRFSGLDQRGTNRSQIISSAEKVNPGLAAFFNIPDNLQAQSGSVVINTDELKVQDKGLISVINQGTGDAGDIEINASTISLNNQGEIGASTLSGEGGNITLNTYRLQLFNNSLISTSAEGLGNGGNIEINTDTLLAINNSDITGKAIRGNGGNITITADGILGIEEREATLGNGTSDIDASSELGEDGTVTITNPQVLIQDPIITVKEIDTSAPGEKIKNACWDGTFPRRKRKLVYTGRGGFPTSPYDFSDDEEYIPAPGWVAPPAAETEDWDFPAWKEGDPLIEANNVRVDKNGEVYLVAELSPQNTESLLCTAREAEEEKATATSRQLD